LTEVEQDFDRVKRELAQIKQERDIFKSEKTMVGNRS